MLVSQPPRDVSAKFIKYDPPTAGDWDDVADGGSVEVSTGANGKFEKLARSFAAIEAEWLAGRRDRWLGSGMVDLGGYRGEARIGC